MTDKQEVRDYRGKPRVRTINNEESKTVQSDAHLADINHILATFNVQGEALLDEAALVFADVSEFGDYKDVMDNMKLAETDFLALPSKVREVFDHDVAVWLDTMHDDDKREKLVERGFLNAPEKPAPVPEPVVADVVVATE